MASKTPQSRQPGKPGKPKPAAKSKAGDGLMGWLGRQVGHVKQAVQADVTKPKVKKAGGQASGKQASPAPGAARTQSGRQATSAKAAPADPDAPSIIVYRQDNIEEAEMPHQPGVKLRRTIIDEVIVVKKKG